MLNSKSMAAPTTNPSISLKFFGSQVLLSPPTPKTTRTLPYLSRKKFLIAQSILNKPNYSHILKYLPSLTTLAALLFSSITPQALAINESVPPPNLPSTLIQAEAPSNSSPFSQTLSLTAPKPRSSDLLEGIQWRYSEFLNAVKKGKVEKVRFNKDGGVLQLTAVDSRRASVVIPNDPDLIDILAMNGVDISVSEGESGYGLFSFIGNLIFLFLAFAGLFFLF